MVTDKGKEKDHKPKTNGKRNHSAHPPEGDKKGFPVIGIGASAGGLEAFGSFFSKMPQDTGMAFILIQHIEPSHVGNMANLIQKYTTMPVIEVKASLKVEPDHLYMIPQNREISMSNGILHLGEVVDAQLRHSIDLLFRSLSDDLKDKAICVVLSGTGTDGTVGARAVKAETGLVIVQDPEDAAYAGMPQSAINAGVADLVLPANQMAEKLIEYVKGAYGRPAERRRKALETSTDSLKQLLGIVKSKAKRDFSGYKVSTINRRIERRMSINKIEELETTREELQSMNEELTTLNSENEKRIDELIRVSDDMKNLLNSTDIATIFVDEDLTIKRFTPAISRVLNLLDRDVGRQITDITSKLGDTDLTGYIKQVLDKLIPVKREVRTVDGRWYSAHIAPYRTSENVIEGAVITFVDVNSQKELQAEMKNALDYANSILDTVREPMLVLDDSLKIISVNHAFYRVFQSDKSQTEGKYLYDLGNRQWNIPELRRLLEEILPQNTEFKDFIVEHEFPGIGRRKIALNARRLQVAVPGAPRILLAMEDITERKV